MKKITPKINTIKKCEECNYYTQHYIKRNTRLYKISCGHCTSQNNKKMTTLPCEYWEDIAIKTEKRKQSIKELIIVMAERLDDIAMILKDDKIE